MKTFSELTVLFIPKKYRGNGLHVYCFKCRTPVTAKPCSHASAQRYRSIIWNPFTKKQDCTQTHDTRNFDEAFDLHRAYRKRLVANNYGVVAPKQERVDYQAISIKDAAMKYLDYLADGGAYDFEKKELTKQHITDATRYVERLLVAVKGLRGRVSDFPIAALDRADVDAFYKLVHSLGLSPRSYNAHMVGGQLFVKYVKEELKVLMDNPFDKVKLAALNYKPQGVKISDFETFLTAIRPENGIGQKGKKKVENVNYYRPWLRKVYMLAVLVGERGDGLVLLSWKDCQEKMIRIPNWKVNRINKGTLRYVDTPMTADLRDILSLFERGAPDDYVVEPAIQNRATLKEFISKAFTHFWSKSGATRQATFKALRKTYITELTKSIGEKALLVKHGSIMTGVKHYLEQEALAEATKDVRFLTKIER